MPRRIPVAVALALCASVPALAQSAKTVPGVDKITPHTLHETTTDRPLTQPSQAIADHARSQRVSPLHVTAKDRDRAAALSVKATKALLAGHPAEAQRDFLRAAMLDPENSRFTEDAVIARENWVSKLVHDAAKAKATGQSGKAQQDLSKAALLAPGNPEVTQHFEKAEAGRNFEIQTPGAPVSLAPTPGLHSFHFSAPAQQVVQVVMRAWGIEATCDTSMPNTELRFHAGDLSFKKAEQALELSTHTFAVPLDAARVLFVPDTPANRLEYQRLSIETLYLPGISESERTHIMEMVRGAFDLQNVIYDASSEAMTIRGPQRQLDALNKTLTSLLQGQSQILLDVKMYVISRTRTTEQGVLLPSGTTLFNIPSEVRNIINGNQSLVQQIISSGLAAPNDYIAIAAILIASGQVTGTVFNQPFGYFGGGLTATGLTSSGITGAAKLNSSDVTELDQMQMLALNQQDEEIRSGTRYPIITSSYSNLAGSNLSIPGISSPGISSALANLGINASSLLSTRETIPQVQYQNLGLTLHVTPFVAGHGDITLKLDLKLQTLEGQTLNDIPVLNSREVNSITSLKPGESALLVSSLSKQDSLAVTGIPGINDLPGLRGGTHQNHEKDVAELAIVITPHVVRRVHSNRADRMIVLPVGSKPGTSSK